MDSTTAGGLGIFGILISAGGIIYSAVNHKKFRCRCCGKVWDASIDIDPTEPVIVKKKSSENVVKQDEELGTQTPPPSPVVPMPPPIPRLPPLPPRKKHRRTSIAPAPPAPTTP
jgi:hypothetical protein